MPNKILIITYYWPPSGGPGVQRWLKFIKYLPSFGFEPIVLTVSEKYATYPQIDKSLENDILDNLKVFKTKSFELYSLYKRLTNKKEVPFSGFANEKKSTLIQKLSRFIRGNFFIPDPRKGWNRFAYKKALQIIQEYNIKTIVTTSPPHSTQLIGLKLKKRLNIKWVADLRDPWTDILYYNKFYPTFLSKKIDRSYEKKVIINSDKVITVGKTMKDDLKHRYNINDEKFKVITNGYDEDDFKNIIPFQNQKFTITYTGTISDIYPMDTFIEAIKELDKPNINVKVIGNIYKNIIKKIDQLNLKHLFEFVDRLPHQTAISYMVSSDLLLLLIPKTKDSKSIITGKIFEYLASKKPILAIGPTNGDAAYIIKSTSSGIICDFNDINNVKKAIGKFYSSDFSSVEINEKEIEKYSRKELTRKLTELFS